MTTILGIILRIMHADNLEHNAEKLQEILNRIMQRIMSIITSALLKTSLIEGTEQTNITASYMYT